MEFFVPRKIAQVKTNEDGIVKTQGYKQKEDFKPMEKSTNVSNNDLSEAPHLIFERFLKNDGLQEICNRINKYAKSKGNLGFDTTEIEILHRNTSTQWL